LKPDFFPSPPHEGHGYGYELVEHAEQLAREKRIPNVFALTNRAADFFKRAGYWQTETDTLPEPRKAQLAASGRDSLVFRKTL